MVSLRIGEQEERIIKNLLSSAASRRREKIQKVPAD
jgi:hypothetical protein